MDSAIHVWIEVDGTPARVLDKTLRGSNSASCFVEAKDSKSSKSFSLIVELLDQSNLTLSKSYSTANGTFLSFFAALES